MMSTQPKGGRNDSAHIPKMSITRKGIELEGEYPIRLFFSLAKFCAHRILFALAVLVLLLALTTPVQ
ncbi:MAG: hypothetical protein Q8K28_09485 [Hoeflea sp.]|uniref:hypothetical protein n=1 Tax=Hoeflea sp. TaxID=1940281 RepID=UPI00272F555F|nr:hypothetical protein [Hoeflea sp.]MDP2120122.1 hypothetical protein [Hoeflea sp.]